jgi:alginate O-acetyltransferase complex protein AlgI
VSLVGVEFLVLMVATFAVYWWLPRRLQNVQLVVTSLVFYGWVHPWWALLLLYSAALDFSCGRAMERWPSRKRAFLFASLIGNGGLLVAFKYFDFFVENAAFAANAVGLPIHPQTLGLLLPVGLSFYTFQALGYSIDVYRGKVPACRDPLSFLLFVSFFPQLLMGPISRAGAMLPQIAARRRLTSAAFTSGVSLALWGAFKKVVIAETVAGFVRPVFQQDSASSAMVWSAAVGASVMMFADFSGYSDLARGTARLLGFELPLNFRAPYLATTPSEWWSRWHISFYSWMGDYVFQPLVLTGWCRRWLVLPFVKPTASVHLARGILLTLLLSGLWHGAAWHYVVWGAFMGCTQLAYFFVGRSLPAGVRSWRHGNWVLRPLMWAIVATSELLFQVSDLTRIAAFLRLDPLAGSPEQWARATTVGVVTLVGAAPMALAWAVETRWGDRIARHPAYLVLTTAIWCLLAWTTFVFYSPSDADFQYFRF